MIFSPRAVLLILMTAAVLSGCRAVPPPPQDPITDDGFAGRRALLLDRIANHYQPVDYSDRGKYSFPVVIARMLAYGPADARAAAYVEEYTGGKYGFFHFPFIGMARILEMFPDAPAVAANRTAFLREILQHDPDFHYNALTGEGTENHVAMSRTSGYLFAQQALEIPELHDLAAEWLAQLEEWILDWSHRLYRYGAGEWDSNPYTAYNLVGWLNLYDFADKPEIRNAARAVLDFHAANIALKLTQGLHGGPESRGMTRYGPLPRSATEYIAWLWFGDTGADDPERFFRPSEYIQAVHAATSAYRPPAALMDLARKRIPTPALYHNAKPDYLMTRKAHIRETFLIGDTFTLGTAETPHGGWINTAYGNINWKLVMRDPAGLPAVVIGNGGMKSTRHGRGRNPFDQFLQYRNTVVQLTRVPANAEAIAAEVAAVFAQWKAEAGDDFAARWGEAHQFEDSHMSDSGRGSLEDARLSIVHFPAEIEVTTRGGAAFFRHAGTYVALHTVSGRPPRLEPGGLIDSAPRGAVAGFVVEVATAADHASFNAFMQAAEARGGPLPDPDDPLAFRIRTLAGDVMEFRYADSGQWSEMIYDWGHGVREQRVGFNSGDWRQPEWPSGRNHGRIAQLRVNGAPPPRPGPESVIDGPFLSLRDGVLTIRDTRGASHEVDYSRRGHPHFRTDHGMRNRQD
jgi:hypothetical protein